MSQMLAQPGKSKGVGGNGGHFDNKIDPPGSEGLESMRLANNVLEAEKSILRGSRIEPAKIRAERSTIPSFSFLCSLTSLFRYRAAHRFQHFFHFGIFGPIFRGRQESSIYPSTSATWLMARRVDARRR